MDLKLWIVLAEITVSFVFAYVYIARSHQYTRLEHLAWAGSDVFMIWLLASRDGSLEPQHWVIVALYVTGTVMNTGRALVRPKYQDRERDVFALGLVTIALYAAFVGLLVAGAN